MSRLASPRTLVLTCLLSVGLGRLCGCLGNIWRFPYVAGENGGVAFVLVYVAFGISVPILMAKMLIGRRGGALLHESTPGGDQVGSASALQTW